jgi:SpoVK/Ycf46/Vps4 family AAA+-type ATPase
LPANAIRQVAEIAKLRADLQGRHQVSLEDVAEASSSLNRQSLDTLASRLETNGTWESLVAGEQVTRKLRDLERRCRHREGASGYLGPAFSTIPSRGVKALFTGPSGTGKTLASRILSSLLGLDLYRVDLSAVVNKYIGETEKNLHRILSRAEELDVILLLDEGDSLLGNRTEVKSSNDRYANLETNFLLQRLESHQGIVFITSNAAKLIDSAFQRRLDLVVEFPLPGRIERRRLWELHLPADHGLPSDFLDRVAANCAFSGGQIRNAAFAAGMLAAEAALMSGGKGAMSRHHLEESISSEYRKAGGLNPLARVGGRGEGRVMDDFLLDLKFGV